MESIHVLLLAIFGFIGYYVFFVVKVSVGCLKLENPLKLGTIVLIWPIIIS